MVLSYINLYNYIITFQVIYQYIFLYNLKLFLHSYIMFIYILYKSNGGYIAMAVGKDKTQVLLTLTKEDKANLKQIADNENRTVTNLINTIIKNYLKEHTKED